MKFATLRMVTFSRSLITRRKVGMVRRVRTTMIKVDGKEHLTISDVRSQFGGVSEKTIRQWIDTGIIDRPPEIGWGLRDVWIFPAEYIAKAKEDLARHRKNRTRNHRRSAGRS